MSRSVLPSPALLLLIAAGLVAGSGVADGAAPRPADKPPAAQPAVPDPASPAAPAKPADAALGKQLDGLGIKYQVDEDGDYRMTFEVEDGRSQLVFARSPVETFGDSRIREIWSPAFRYATPELDQKIANRLLSHGATMIMGGWTRQKTLAMFVVKVPADASPQQLRDALEAAALAADEIERELTPDKDEF